MQERKLGFETLLGSAMTLATIDPVDVLIMVVPTLIYSVAFFVLYAASRIRERRAQASRKRRLEELCGRAIGK
jgi:hypothetical protein